jgi:three-Cys-motif partner protein
MAKNQDNMFLLPFVGLEENDADFAEYIQGSPRVALDIDHPFTHYYFVEKNPEHIEKLKALKTEYAETRNITIYEGDALRHLNVFIESVKDWRSSRAVVFLDPFGMQVPWQTICDIAQKRSIEIILNLPIGTTIQRLIKKDRANMSQKDLERLTSYFGSEEWEQIVYYTSSLTSLFDNEPTVLKYDDTAERLIKWYMDRLRVLFGHTAGPKLIKNTRGAHLYYLIWAGSNETGKKIAGYVLGNKVSRKFSKDI